MANHAANDALVADNLQHAATAQPLTEQPVREGDGLEGHTTAPGGAEHVVSPTALGLDSTGWVAFAGLVVILIMLWRKVPAMIGRALDGRITAIRTQLDEAATLRAEAEALKAEYEGRARSAHTDAEAMRTQAHEEAARIVAKAKQDAEDLMGRRARMAQDKIAAAERAAIAEVRAKAAAAAASAAQRIIEDQYDAVADRPQIDRTIARLGRFN